MNEDQIAHFVDTIQKAQLPDDGKFVVYDGRTGDIFDQTVSI